MTELIRDNPLLTQTIAIAICSFIGTVFTGLLVWLLKMIFSIRADVDKLKANDGSLVDDLKKLEQRFERNEGEYSRIFDSIWETAQNLKMATLTIETNWADFRKNSHDMQTDFKEMREAFTEFTEKVNESVHAIRIEVAKRGHHD